MKKTQQTKITLKAMTSKGLKKFEVIENIRPKVGEYGVFNSMLYKVLQVDGVGHSFSMKVQSYKDIEILLAGKHDLSQFRKVVSDTPIIL